MRAEGWEGSQGGVQGAEPLGGALPGVYVRSCCRSRSCCSYPQPGLLIRLQLPGVTQGPLPPPLSYFFFEATCGEPTWVSWAGRGQHAPHPRPGCARGTWLMLSTSSGAQPDALGSGADPLLLQTQLLPLPLQGLPLAAQLSLLARSSLAP